MNSMDDIENLSLHEVTYLSNYLQNVLIDLYLQGKIKQCPIESEMEIDKEFARNMFNKFGSFDWME